MVCAILCCKRRITRVYCCYLYMKALNKNQVLFFVWFMSYVLTLITTTTTILCWIYLKICAFHSFFLCFFLSIFVFLYISMAPHLHHYLLFDRHFLVQSVVSFSTHSDDGCFGHLPRVYSISPFMWNLINFLSNVYMWMCVCDTHAREFTHILAYPIQQFYRAYKANHLILGLHTAQKFCTQLISQPNNLAVPVQK